MSGRITEDNFHTTKLKPLAEKILMTLEKRFTDVSEDVVAATRIANFRQWPLFSMKEDVTGRVSSSLYKNVKLFLMTTLLYFSFKRLAKKKSKSSVNSLLECYSMQV